MPATERVLGVEFFRGTVEEACLHARKGGLITAPSGPGLAFDLPQCPIYRDALANSDLVLPDSGLLCLWEKCIKGRSLPRVSGLALLRSILKSMDWEKERPFWVMPDEKQAQANVAWLKANFGKPIEPVDVYVAPQYSASGFLQDDRLLSKIEERRSSSVFLQVGGGVQERLGLFLKENLSFSASIYCTGAALAFLSGQQARIPGWADQLYLGWLMRCLANPKVFLPRYLKALRLLILLGKYGEKWPIQSGSST